MTTIETLQRLKVVYGGSWAEPAIDEAISALRALEGAKAAITKYHNALDLREHGGLAADVCIKKIEDELGMPWVRGATLKEKSV